MSFLYEMVTGKQPYNELEDNDVEKLFERAESLSTTNIHLGRIVRGYQHGKFGMIGGRKHSQNNVPFRCIPTVIRHSCINKPN